MICKVLNKKEKTECERQGENYSFRGIPLINVGGMREALLRDPMGPPAGCTSLAVSSLGNRLLSRAPEPLPRVS